MARASRLTLLLLLLLVQPGCFYGNFKVPLDVDVMDTKIGEKQGEASAHAVLWLVSWGDCGVHAAAEAGDLEVIHHLDSEFFVFLFGAYTRRTTIAYGD